MSEKILVVDDEVTLQETLTYNLLKQGYTVVSASDGASAIQLARKEQPDLIILDIMLPGMDGLEVCRILRKEMNTPVIMLTARDDEIDRVVGLEMGGDDYLTKPFSMRELIARVKAMLRRSNIIQEAFQAGSVGTAGIIQSGNLRIDLDRHEVHRSEKLIALKPKEYELLLHFAQNPRIVISRDTLLQKVWGWDYIGESRTVDVHIRWLREKIEMDPQNPVRLVTVRGSGYRFEG